MTDNTKSHVDTMLLAMADTYLDAHRALKRENDELKIENATLKAKLQLAGLRVDE